jgi:hypothetical protein
MTPHEYRQGRESEACRQATIAAYLGLWDAIRGGKYPLLFLVVWTGFCALVVA